MNYNCIRRLLIFEGISGSGKSTLEDEYRRINEYHDYTMHRFTPSKYVYALLYRRRIDLKELQESEMRIQEVFPTFLITCTVNPTIARDRKIAMKDKNIETEMPRAQALFKNYASSLSVIKNCLTVNTEKSIDECVLDIIDFVK